MCQNKRRLALLLALVLCAAMIFAACGGQTQEQPAVEQTQPVETEQPVKTEPQQTTPRLTPLQVESITQQETMMLVKTNYCTVKYPYAFSDLIMVEAMQEQNCQVLLFCIMLEDVEYPLFALRFGDAEGIHVGSLKLPETGVTVGVWAQLYEADKLVKQNNTYIAAQECVNDVITALEEDPNFTPFEG